MATLDPYLLAEWSGGKWANGAPERIGGVSNDTRTLTPGDLFAAFVTERRDGHEFLSAALAMGASGAVVERIQDDTPLPQLVVADVGSALREMAARFRASWSIPVVGVTGSCGKTTCKDLLNRILGPERTLSTRGNLNNLIGVPMSILREEAAAARFAALEAGISEPGEMAQLARMIDPDWAVFTSIGPSHLQDLDSEETIAREKGMLAQGERVRGIFIGETCEPYASHLGGALATVVKRDPDLAKEWSYRFETIGGEIAIQQRVRGEVECFRVKGMGQGLASNVALAVAVATSLDVGVEAIQKGLAAWRPATLRGEWRQLGAARAFVDCYNANPLSMDDALGAFVASSRPETPRFFVIGCMEELGREAPRFHEELGCKLPFRKEDFLLVIGDEASSVLRGMRNAGHDMSRCREFGSIEEARKRIENFAGDVFLKGSRRYRLEGLLSELTVESEERRRLC